MSTTPLSTPTAAESPATPEPRLAVRHRATPGAGVTMYVADLSELLHETSLRHGAFEAAAPPHDWWDWYAAYMDARRAGSTPDEASAAADRYMADVKHVVAAPA
jgi:hypothetical protein